MNKWNQSGIPHSGWVCGSVYDTGSDDSSCEKCGNGRVRYVHFMSHPEFNEQLEVGCVCAEKMSGDSKGPRERENRLRRRVERRKRWLAQCWNENEKGNYVLKTNGFRITIFHNKRYAGWWSFVVGGEYSKTSYKTSDEAKLAAFDVFWEKYISPPDSIITKQSQWH